MTVSLNPDDSTPHFDYIVVEVVEDFDQTYDAQGIDFVDASAADSDMGTDTSDQTAHADAAYAAQQEADADVASGDYAAASEARENAENESYAAGDDSMLHGSNATDLSTANTDQANAAYNENLEGQAAASGDYASAKEDAQNAASQIHNADYQAGGADHSGQASAEADKEDWAVWHQANADQDAHNADYYAAQGDTDHAQTAAEAATGEQQNAAADGAAGEHGASYEVHDASADVAHDTTVEDHTVVDETVVHDTSSDETYA